VTRWDVTKAVRASDLPAPSRLIMLTLADVAEVGTAEIPERFNPSFRVLAEETGLDKSTVRRHLGALEEAGWIECRRPEDKDRWRGERNRYRLTLPRGVEPPGVEAQNDTLEAEGLHPGGTEHPAVEAQNTQGGGTESPLETDLSYQRQIKPDPLSPSSNELAIPERLDVEHVCRHLADRIEANGSKRPKITKAWRDSARRLIDRDKRTVEQIVRAIDWCQNDPFWRSNVLSMPKLRDKYDQLRLAAQRPNGRASPSAPDIDWNAAMQRAAAREAAQ
jgi:DNA-binding transcriptional ArsR family regulator